MVNDDRSYYALMEEARRCGYCVVVERNGPENGRGFLARAYRMHDSTRDFSEVGATPIEALAAAVRHAHEVN